MLKEKLKTIIENAINNLAKENKLGALKSSDEITIIIEKPKNADFGDFSINVSPYSRIAKIAPQQIASELKIALLGNGFDINVVGGFINFKLHNDFYSEAVKNILSEKENFGSNNFGKGEKVLLEYVSANPTGPLHIGHGRWAAMGSALANLMKKSGYDVTQEFYINDAGNQINNLAHSLFIRVLQELNVNINFPTDEVEVKNYYTGDYLIKTAKEFIEEKPDELEIIKNKTDYDEEAKEILGSFAKAKMETEQHKLLDMLNVHFDNYYSELTLHKAGKVVECLENLEKTGHTYREDGALWFKTTTFGDEKDRVLIKQDGAYTYLSADIAYHIDKLKRGYERLINIWGADHHGYVPRIKASLEAFGYDSNALEVLLGQLVNLIINNEQVRMGKRKKMVTLEELVDEVGVDATRYWIIMRDINRTLDFDVDLAKSKADENPVFYVQYANARACSILRNLTKPRLNIEDKTELPPLFTQSEIDEITDNSLSIDISNLWNCSDVEIQATKNIIQMIDSFEDVVINATKNRAPYMIAKYMQELAADFHKFYSAVRVITDDKKLSKSRVALIFAIKTVLENAFDILGVSAPESM
ncbi:MAG: arginine--tRNA ligase [Candidatus Gastranaerophilales bacterium]|nr:arginine--tRNA ligase [Candidatus Gastranaerophilales bacterium]